MRNNIVLAYILAFCSKTWFWLGVWIFYYLKFTNYAGIGVAETVLIVTFTVSEIPTGALADLLGKKITLALSFLLQAVGYLMMATAGSFPVLLLSIFVMCVGGTFYSGTLEALVFDSLKQVGKEGDYDKKISNVNTIQLLAPAICGAVGGFMYTVSNGLPFVATAVFCLVGLLATGFLTEPKIDSEKFSWTNFTKQTRYGLLELFKNSAVKWQTVLLLSVGFFVVINSEMLNSFLGVELGFDAKQLGVLWSIIFLVSAGASQFTPVLYRKFGGRVSIAITGAVIGITLLASPLLGMMLGAAVLMVRSAFEGIFGNLASIIVNNNTQSKYRATTISTFHMIKNIPYVLLAFLIGSISDRISAMNMAVILGGILLGLIGLGLKFGNRGFDRLS